MSYFYFIIEHVNVDINFVGCVFKIGKYIPYRQEVIYKIHYKIYYKILTGKIFNDNKFLINGQKLT